VALSSDAPVVENDSPLAGMQAAILRRDSDGERLAMDEAISIDEALDAYTRGGAIAVGAERKRGTLCEGMQADMTVLSGDPLRTPAEALTTLRVRQTWVGGRLVYEE
jgi:predicted amidohydrolase YtcJ